jgi:hypothetical protein
MAACNAALVMKLAAAKNNLMIGRFALIPISGPMYNVYIDWDLPYD